jgi:hypothetical protein
LKSRGLALSTFSTCHNKTEKHEHEYLTAWMTSTCSLIQIRNSNLYVYIYVFIYILIHLFICAHIVWDISLVYPHSLSLPSTSNLLPGKTFSALSLILLERRQKQW